MRAIASLEFAIGFGDFIEISCGTIIAAFRPAVEGALDPWARDTRRSMPAIASSLLGRAPSTISHEISPRILAPIDSAMRVWKAGLME